MRKLFIGIIGGRNAGKSTIIKSLTGCPNKSTRAFVDDLQTGNSIYVCASSPQENPLTEENLQQIINDVESRSQCIGIVMAIQHSKPYVNISMERIYHVLLQNNYEVYAFFIDPPRNAVRNNEDIFESVRSRLNILSVDIIRMDGRRFSYLNAYDVSGITNLFNA